MIRYRLYEHPPAALEHLIHTFRGFLFIPIVVLFFVLNSAGWLLWLGIVLLTIDFLAELVDIVTEKEARKELGGVSPFETAIHITATGFRMAALGIVLALKPISAWTFSADIYGLSAHPNWFRLMGSVFVGGLSIALLSQMTFSVVQRLSVKKCFCYPKQSLA